MRPRHAARVLAAACLALVALPASAPAAPAGWEGVPEATVGIPPAAPRAAGGSGSIVMTWKNNVWLMDPSGEVFKQVTSNGTADNPWLHPSMTGDGLIAAVRHSYYTTSNGAANGKGTVYLMNQAGKVLKSVTPIQLDGSGSGNCFSTGIGGTAVSPNGQYVAFTYGLWLGSYPTCPDFYLITNIVPFTNGGAYQIPSDYFSQLTASWQNDNRVLMAASTGRITYFDLNAPQNGIMAWFGDSNLPNEADPELNLAGGVLATAEPADIFYGSDSLLGIWKATSGPPAAPSRWCYLTGPAGQFASPTWSPDGTILAWEESDGNNNISGEGVWLAQVQLNQGGGCTVNPLFGSGPAVPNAVHPDWSPAASKSTARKIGSTLVYEAGAGMANKIVVTKSDGRFIITDNNGHAILPGSGCIKVSSNQVSCAAKGVGTLQVDVADMGDVVTIKTSTSALVSGGAGADKLTGGPAGDSLYGDSGNDTLSGGDGNDLLDGGDGTDACSGGSGTNDIRACE